MTPPSCTRRGDAEAFVTKDASTVRELMHPARHGNRAQSLAEAVVDPGRATIPHYHKESEELYHVLDGEAEMTLGEEVFTIRVGDTVHIPPGTPHGLRNTGDVPFRVLCCSAPAYAHADTVLLE